MAWDPRRRGEESRIDERAAEILGNDVRAPRSLRHQMHMESAVQLGQPDFAHTVHIVLTIVTAGLWLLIYVPAWLMSSRRRYQRARRAQLRAEGLL